MTATTYDPRLTIPTASHAQRLLWDATDVREHVSNHSSDPNAHANVARFCGRAAFLLEVWDELTVATREWHYDALRAHVDRYAHMYDVLLTGPEA